MTQAAFEGGWRKLVVREQAFETTEGVFSLKRPVLEGAVRIAHRIS